MTTLFTTDTAAILCHILIDVLISNGSLSITDTLLIKCFVQTKVGHNCCNNGVGQELATLFHVAAIDVQNVIACNDITLLVHTQAAIGITIIGKTNIQTFLHNELLQALNMSRTSVVVNVQSIGLIVDYIGVCAKCIKNRLCNVPGTAIGTIQANLDTLEGVDAQRDQVAHVAVTTCHIVHSAADMLTMSKGQFRPVLVEHMELAVNVVLYQQQSFFWHLFSVAVN